VERSRKEDEDAVLEGVLIPVRWGAGGDVSQVGLMTFDESEYRLDAALVEAHDLRRYLRKHIRIVGRTRGYRLVRVTAVEILEWPVPSSVPRPWHGEDP
jgi:hypothetical protein